MEQAVINKRHLLTRNEDEQLTIKQSLKTTVRLQLHDNH